MFDGLEEGISGQNRFWVPGNNNNNPLLATGGNVARWHGFRPNNSSIPQMPFLLLYQIKIYICIRKFLQNNMSLFVGFSFSAAT
jgi:hypothetical protein